MKKTLFVLKRGNNFYPNKGLSGAAYLTSQIVENSVVDIAFDGNDIERLISQHNPDVLILEAIWVTPSKVEELMTLYPDVQFVVRIHSRVEFLAEEGQVFDWLFNYKCDIASNHEDTAVQLSNILLKNVIYLPNGYPKPKVHCGQIDDDVFRVSCFGASRILKNQLSQAIAAIQYADMYNKNLEFHINKEETQIIKNIRNVFRYSNHKLVEHEWLPTEEFLSLISSMNIGMQVSLTETFNLVAADHVWQSVPMVVSNKVDWLDSDISDSYNIDEIREEIRKVDLENPIELQTYNLILYNFEAKRIWVEFTT